MGASTTRIQTNIFFIRELCSRARTPQISTSYELKERYVA